MSRWFRFYDDAINDPKILKLPEASRWHWTALLCIASKHDGFLPAIEDVALMLRVKPAAAAAIIAQMKQAGLLDLEEGKYAPHNWSGRQYKSDVSTDRVKRFRNGKRNVSPAVTETAPETEADTEQKQRTEANASGALAPIDPRTRLFREGLADLAEMTGKGPDACRSFVGKCLQAASDDAVVVLGLIDDAKRNRVANPSAWIAARLKPADAPLKPRTAHQQERETGREILNALRDASSRTNSGFQRHDPGNGSASLRGGVRGALIDLSAGRDREGHEPVEGTSFAGQLSEPGKVSGSS